MKHPVAILALLLALFTVGCGDTKRSRSEAKDLLKSLSLGKSPAGYAGIYGEAVDKLRSAQTAQDTPITFTIKSGDAEEPIGDGSCDYHAFAYVDGSNTPFLGIRLAHRSDGWHIAGYWTPTKAEQDVAPQSATRSKSKSEGDDKPQPESEERSR